VQRAAGGGGRIVFQPLPQGDPKQRRPDITRARTLLGWEPKVPLEVGLAPTVAWFRNALP
jgi:dTDP-glucose 4,6-dehydratase